MDTCFLVFLTLKKHKLLWLLLGWCSEGHWSQSTGWHFLDIALESWPPRNGNLRPRGTILLFKISLVAKKGLEPRLIIPSFKVKGTLSPTDSPPAHKTHSEGRRKAKKSQPACTHKIQHVRNWCSRLDFCPSSAASVQAVYTTKLILI